MAGAEQRCASYHPIARTYTPPPAAWPDSHDLDTIIHESTDVSVQPAPSYSGDGQGGGRTDSTDPPQVQADTCTDLKQIENPVLLMQISKRFQAYCAAVGTKATAQQIVVVNLDELQGWLYH